MPVIRSIAASEQVDRAIILAWKVVFVAFRVSVSLTVIAISIEKIEGKTGRFKACVGLPVLIQTFGKNYSFLEVVQIVDVVAAVLVECQQICECGSLWI